MAGFSTNMQVTDPGKQAPQQLPRTGGNDATTLWLVVAVAFGLLGAGWAAMRFASFTIAEWLALLMSAFALLGVAQRIALARRLERAP